MIHWPIKLYRRDLGLIVLVTAHLLCIGGFLRQALQTASEPVGGWRRIDLKALTERIRAGDLVNKEAEWYRSVEEQHHKVVLP